MAFYFALVFLLAPSGGLHCESHLLQQLSRSPAGLQDGPHVHTHR